MIGPQHVCALYLATAGLQGPALGSDEEEVVLLVYVVIEVPQNKVIGAQQYLVKPNVADVNENVLSEQLTTGTLITEDLVKSAGQPLDAALRSFDHYVRSLGVDPCSAGFHLITDGQLPLRQCLHPEACTKDLELPPYYCTFYDVRKEVTRFLGPAKLEEPIQNIKEVLTYLNMSPDLDNEFYIKEAKDMVNIIQRLVSEGHRFEAPETINLVLEPGICSKDDEIDGNCVVRARGLPWQSSDQDIAKFFRGLNVAKGGVALCLSPQGRRNGEALVRFTCQEHRDMALKRHKHHIGARYIEVYRASGEDFLSVAGGASCEAQAFLSRGAQVIVRMRGLPYDCTPKQVLEFFASGEQPCTVLDGPDGVLFVKKPDGRATGDAFVLFAEESDAPKALAKHRELIGSRYIELFRSTTAEVQQVLNRSMDPKTYEQPQPLIAQLPQVPLLPQHIITSGTRKDCIRLRGLPYEAQVEHILDFLGEHAKSIVFQGVHMVYNAQGQPSGEAFIQMDSEHSAFMAAQQRHHRYMVFGKKQRYIEVFQCSGEDMNLVLTGGIPAPVSPAKAATAALLSPGMLNLPPTNVPPPPPAPAPPASVATLALAQSTVPNTTVAQISQNLVAPPSPALSWENPALYAQQQAQMIAQQSLLARQSQAAHAAAAAHAHGEQMMLMNQLAAAQHGLAFLNHHGSAAAVAGPPSPAKQHHHMQLMHAPQQLMHPHHQQHPLLLVPHHHRLPPLSVPRAPLMTQHHLMPATAAAAPGLLPLMPHHVAVKRSYGDAFAEQTAPAKRAFQTVHFQPFYPHM